MEGEEIVVEGKMKVMVEKKVEGVGKDLWEKEVGKEVVEKVIGEVRKE